MVEQIYFKGGEHTVGDKNVLNILNYITLQKSLGAKLLLGGLRFPYPPLVAGLTPCKMVKWIKVE